MKRRDFTRGLMTTALAAPPILGPTSALANFKEDEESMEYQFAQIVLSLFGKQIAPTALMIVLQSAVLGVSLTGTHRRFEENRRRVGGLLGTLTRPTIAARMEAAVLLGSLHLYGSTLIVLPQRQIDIGALRLMIAHQAVSWEIAKRIGRMNVSGLPNIATLRKAQQIGALYLVAETLALAMVMPVLGRSNWRAP